MLQQHALGLLEHVIEAILICRLLSAPPCLTQDVKVNGRVQLTAREAWCHRQAGLMEFTITCSNSMHDLLSIKPNKTFGERHTSGIVFDLINRHS